MLIQYRPQGRNASEISRDVETAVREGRIAPGVTLPPVRGLAGELGLSPVTVAAAYRELREKGIARGNGRAGTRITGAPPIGPRPPIVVPAGVRNLLAGSPDPALLPGLPAVASPRRMYGDPPVVPRLGRLAAERFRADGIDPQHLAVIGGALDGVERVLQAWLRPGDRVAVEDPGYFPVLDLLTAMTLGAVPMAVDELGVRPDALRDALGRGCQAVLFTPRAQAPTTARCCGSMPSARSRSAARRPRRGLTGGSPYVRGGGVTAGRPGSSAGSGLPASRLRTPAGTTIGGRGPIGGASVIRVPARPFPRAIPFSRSLR